MENAEYIFPSGTDITRLRIHHLRNTPYDHVSDGRRPAKSSISQTYSKKKIVSNHNYPPIFLHNKLERTQEIFLEFEIRKFSFFDKLHRKLSQRVEREHRDIFVRIASDFVEILSQHLPNARPLEPNTAHIVVRNLDDFLQTEHARMVHVTQLFQRDLPEK